MSCQTSDAWMVFVRESSHGGDPALSYIYEGSFTWQSALIVTRAGDRIAIVGKFDDGAVRAAGQWTEVVPYVQSIRDPLVETIRRLDPRTLAIDFSVDDHAADGLTHGMYLLLLKYVAGTPYADRLVSADEVVGALRGRKSPNELARIETAIATAQTIFDEVGQFAKPGMTEREVARFMQDRARQRGVELAWAPPCPIVNTGPHSMIGHGVPSDLRIEPGHILHIDFGVQQDGYCSDLQRCWYVPRPGEHSPPEPVRPRVQRRTGGPKEFLLRRTCSNRVSRAGRSIRLPARIRHRPGQLSGIRTRRLGPSWAARHTTGAAWWEPGGRATRENAVSQSGARQRVHAGTEIHRKMPAAAAARWGLKKWLS